MEELYVCEKCIQDFTNEKLLDEFEFLRVDKQWNHIYISQLKAVLKQCLFLESYLQTRLAKLKNIFNFNIEEQVDHDHQLHKNKRKKNININGGDQLEKKLDINIVGVQEEQDQLHKNKKKKNRQLIENKEDARKSSEAKSKDYSTRPIVCGLRGQQIN